MKYIIALLVFIIIIKKELTIRYN